MNPYPGLRPFRPEEAGLFMGREAVTNVVKTRIRVSPLTVLFARSGVGKSSFLNCRLVPLLLEDSRVAYRNEWGRESPPALIEQSISTLDAGGSGTMPETDVLVLDQFEDVFKSPFQPQAVWNSLAEVVNIQSPQIHVLITMREEWLGMWGDAGDYLPDAMGGMVRLAPLTDRELARAVTKPAEIEGSVRVTADFVQVLLQDLKHASALGPGTGNAEPTLLQLICHHLWEEAVARNTRLIDREIYESLGRADHIIRGFVWRELGEAGKPRSGFTAFDRVLWVGLTRHLSVAQGVKAIATPKSLSRVLMMRDLGIAGPAVASSVLEPPDRKYLELVPEKRAIPPTSVVSWIIEVLQKGVRAGFLKRQRGIRGADIEPDMDAQNDIYELSHDSLGVLFQTFVVEFESWVRARWYKVVAVAFAVVFVLPFLLFLAANLGWREVLMVVVIGPIVLAAYIGLIWIMGKIVQFVVALVSHPILRRLIRGSVPLPKARGPSGQNRTLH